jgi:hypothetical protein
MRPDPRRICLALLLASGCASFEGAGLVPGQSDAKKVEEMMGQPKERITLASGDTLWFYPHGPFGSTTDAVRLSPAGVVKSVEQVLTYENIARLKPGETSNRQVREILGPPSGTTHLDRQQRDVWIYPIKNQIQIPHCLNVQFSADGIVREVLTIRDPMLDRP